MTYNNDFCNVNHSSTMIKFCFSSYLFNMIQNYPKDHIILDTRSSMKFKEQHILSSLNINEEYINLNKNKLSMVSEQEILNLNFSELLSTFSEDWKKKLQRLKRKYCFIIMNHEQVSFIQKILSITRKNLFGDNTQLELDYNTIASLINKNDQQMDTYDGNDEEVSSMKIGLALYNMLRSENINELYIMIEGADHFFARYPFMNNCSTLKSNLKYPNEIIKNHIYLGDYSQASNKDIIKNLKITHIVNCTEELKNTFIDDDKIEYYRIPVKDENDTYISQYFDETYKYIEHILESNPNNTILIHCMFGKSRSATITIMYLMKKFQCDYQTAYQYAYDRRNIICPNLGFVEQLEKFGDIKYEYDIKACKLYKNEENSDYNQHNLVQIEVPLCRS